jgi:hypothetical protein
MSCSFHLVSRRDCADCSRPPGTLITAPASLPTEEGLRAVAGYYGSCRGCGEDIEPGDEIRADGRGGWEGRCCDEKGRDRA